MGNDLCSYTTTQKLRVGISKMFTFIQQEFIQLIKSDSKNVYFAIIFISDKCCIF